MALPNKPLGELAAVTNPEIVEHECDVLIVGGGMVGATMAYALSPLPLRIGVVEAVHGLQEVLMDRQDQELDEGGEGPHEPQQQPSCPGQRERFQLWRRGHRRGRLGLRFLRRGRARGLRPGRDPFPDLAHDVLHIGIVIVDADAVGSA